MMVNVRRYTTDRYGDRVLVSQHLIGPCAFAPRLTREVNDRSTQVTAEAELYAPDEADIEPSDEVTLEDGTTWEVDGRPENWGISPWTGGLIPGTVVPLTRVTG